jgi:hypothetical protein
MENHIKKVSFLTLKEKCNAENDTITNYWILIRTLSRVIQLQEAVSKKEEKQLTYGNILSNQMLEGQKNYSTK